MLFCSAVLTPQHYHWHAASRIAFPPRVASWVNYSSQQTVEHFVSDLSLLKADAQWCENKRCSDSNPRSMDPKAREQPTTPQRPTRWHYNSELINSMATKCMRGNGRISVALLDSPQPSLAQSTQLIHISSVSWAIRNGAPACLHHPHSQLQPCTHPRPTKLHQPLLPASTWLGTLRLGATDFGSARIFVPERSLYIDSRWASG